MYSFVKSLTKAAFLSLSISVNAQQDLDKNLRMLDQSGDYPEWAAEMSTRFPDYIWEAHTVNTGDFTKTLFRITGKQSDSSAVATKQPVLLVHGGFSNTLKWLKTDYTLELTQTKNEYWTSFEADL